MIVFLSLLMYVISIILLQDVEMIELIGSLEVIPIMIIQGGNLII